MLQNVLSTNSCELNESVKTNFITMALSVRSHYNNKNFNANMDEEKNFQNSTENLNEVDHYLIETIAGGSNIRLEGSPFTFKSLPLLLEHYCLNKYVKYIFFFLL